MIDWTFALMAQVAPPEQPFAASFSFLFVSSGHWPPKTGPDWIPIRAAIWRLFGGLPSAEKRGRPKGWLTRQRRAPPSLGVNIEIDAGPESVSGCSLGAEQSGECLRAAETRDVFTDGSGPQVRSRRPQTVVRAGHSSCRATRRSEEWPAELSWAAKKWKLHY